MIDFNTNDNLKNSLSGPGANFIGNDQNLKFYKDMIESKAQYHKSSEMTPEISAQDNAKINVKSVYAELEALSSSISHDLRAPLRAIRNNCEWLNTRYSENLDSEGRTIIQQITASSEQMEELLEGLLAFSKVVRFVPKHCLIDMTALTRTVIDELLRNSDGLSSPIVVLKPLLPAYGDETFIRQVWFNLISNAFKYTQYKEIRKVEIDSYKLDGETAYSVVDNGIGFDMEYVNHLFGVFHRLHSIEEYDGTGVGLAIVQRIIQRHGGRVWAEGKVDEGARFFFTLPNIEKNKIGVLP